MEQRNFLFKASDTQTLAQFAPDILDACQRAGEARSEDLDFIRVDQAAFAECRSESIDYAVMEHTTHVVPGPRLERQRDALRWSARINRMATPYRRCHKQHDTHNSLITANRVSSGGRRQ